MFLIIARLKGYISVCNPAQTSRCLQNNHTTQPGIAPFSGVLQVDRRLPNNRRRFKVQASCHPYNTPSWLRNPIHCRNEA